MTFEFLLGLLAVVGFVYLAVWLYAAIFDCVDEWKAAARDWDRAEAQRSTEAAHERLLMVNTKPDWQDELKRERMLREGRLPPMAYELPAGPPDGWERGRSRSRAGREQV